MSVKCLRAYMKFCQELGYQPDWEGLRKWKKLWKNIKRREA